MFMSSREQGYWWRLLVWVFALVPALVQADSIGHGLKPGLGEPLTEFKGTIISVDGSNLPEGSGSVAAGKVLYETRCAACHGMKGEQPGNQLAGGRGSLSGPRPLKTVGSYWPYATTLFDYIWRAMPYDEQKSLDPDQVYAVTGYVLRLNGIVGLPEVLNAKNLAGIKMPNRGGFVEMSE